MTQAIVNLAVPVITGKVDEVLGTYPVSPCQQVFASKTMREKLIAYVLSRVPARYATLETVKTCSAEMPASCFSCEQQTQMDRLIHLGIEHLMTQQQTWETAAQTASVARNLSPSTWFG
ncbi:MAG: hypothetical protein F6J95_014800 [Leptolyngbya sp. SIO1E4]|nr:hypothetical protein [Leptolyngbya sp. SIO1E4]